ncbi:uncharacterized protein BDV17DRAFT_296882 [Aspergillus undulatus]|uniref:uncharacterized protein n=1 Tax=Aspergillus undulatus TaxID=1810928 RepID=UPI003CCDD562
METPLPYTSSPWGLLCEDVRLVFKSAWYIPSLMLPWKPANGGRFNELYLSWNNIGNLLFQLILSLMQLLFLLSIPICFALMVPLSWVCIYIGCCLLANKALCDQFLNKGSELLVSEYPPQQPPELENEHWVFINGIACGRTWMQQNIDRLGHTFGRKVTGVHNPSTGLVFDIIQCLIQRDFSYATQDVRDGYAHLRAALLNPDYTKVVLIAHSQGAIESGLIVDWLLDEIHQGCLRKLEIYTFGNAANHFNNPFRSTPDPQFGATNNSTILHIEHYVNSKDFVGRWGVLNFADIPNRFMGRVFVREGSGHMFNQHYLGTMFPLANDLTASKDNEFMQTEVGFPEYEGTDHSPPPRARIGSLSRLWTYRNGGGSADRRITLHRARSPALAPETLN